MTEADDLVLKALEPSALTFVSQQEWAEIRAAVEQAGGVRQVEGYAKTVLEKAKTFGGNRSAAGSYAARMRWRGSNTEGLAGAEAKAETEARQKFTPTGQQAAAGGAASKPKDDERPDLKRGARVRQTLPNGTESEPMTVSSRKGDMVYLRPDKGPNGYYQHSYTMGLNRRFWGTLRVDPSAPPAP